MLWVFLWKRAVCYAVGFPLKTSNLLCCGFSSGNEQCVMLWVFSGNEQCVMLWVFL